MKNCERLEAFLNENGVARVAFIDDAFEVESWDDSRRRDEIRKKLPETADIQAYLLKRKPNIVAHLAKLDPDKPADKAAIDAALTKYMDSRKDDQLWDDYDAASAENTLKTHRSLLVKCLQKMNRALLLSPSRWQKEGAQVLASDKPTWYVVDYNLSTHGMKGTTLLPDIQASANCRAVMMISGLLDEGEGSAGWRQIDEELKAGSPKADRVLKLSKGEAGQDAMAIAFAFQFDVLRPAAASVTKSLRDILQTATAQAQKQLEDISTRQMTQLVFGTAIADGSPLDTNALRVLTLYLREATTKAWLELLKSSKDKSDAVQELYARMGGVVSAIDPDSNLARKLDFLEHYDAGSLINERHEPLAPGDIFESTAPGSQSRYVLLAQPCAVQMRSDGKRTDQESLDHGFAHLARVVPAIQDEDEAPRFFAGPGHEPMSYVRILNPKEEEMDQITFVNFRRPLLMPLGFLDFCMVNSDGTCKMPAVLPRHAWPGAAEWLREAEPHFERLRRGTVLHRANLDKYPLSDDEKRDVDYAQQRGRAWPQKPAIAFANETVFPLRRIARLRQPYIQSVISQFHAYLARPGFEPPFARAYLA